MPIDNLYRLAADLPAPVEDGAARHLSGLALPPIALLSTDGRSVRLDDTAITLAVVYCYPRTKSSRCYYLGQHGGLERDTRRPWLHADSAHKKVATYAH